MSLTPEQEARARRLVAAGWGEPLLTVASAAGPARENLDEFFAMRAFRRLLRLAHAYGTQCHVLQTRGGYIVSLCCDRRGVLTITAERLPEAVIRLQDLAREQWGPRPDAGGPQ